MYGNPLDFSKIHDIVMNNEIKLTYLLFSVYLSALCSLGPFVYFLFYLFSDFVQSTRYIKQKDTSPLQGFST